MSKLTSSEIESAKIAAKAAVEADRRGDTVARDEAMRQLWLAVGYWLTPRQWTTAEFRGDRIPPKMVRMPAGPAVLWSRGKWRAVQAWAAAA